MFHHVILEPESLKAIGLSLGDERLRQACTEFIYQ